MDSSAHFWFVRTIRLWRPKACHLQIISLLYLCYFYFVRTLWLFHFQIHFKYTFYKQIWKKKDNTIGNYVNTCIFKIELSFLIIFLIFQINFENINNWMVFEFLEYFWEWIVLLICTWLNKNFYQIFFVAVSLFIFYLTICI